MPKNYNINVDDVDIKDWNQFVSNNEEIISSLDTCCSNIADMIANVNTTVGTVSAINDELARLQTVKMNPIPDVDYLSTDINAINEYLKDKSVVIVGIVSYAELAIIDYDVDKDVDKEAKDLMQKILQGLADYSIFWIVSESLRRYSLPCRAIGAVLAYGTDWKYEDGDFLVGDAAAQLFKIASKRIFADNLVEMSRWVNVSVGTGFVVLFEAGKQFMDYQKRKDKWTDTDTMLAIFKVGEAGLSYFEWAAITGAIAGPAGVMVAAVLAVPTTIAWNSINDAIVGDNIIHTFTRDGKTYKVPANGNGKNLSFDVMIDNYNLKEYHIGDRLCSEREYKEKLYTNLDEFIYEDSGKKPKDLDYPIASGDIYMQALDAMAQCDSFEEGLDAFEAYFQDHNLIVDNITTNYLISEYGFDLEEYYNYNHKEG